MPPDVLLASAPHADTFGYSMPPPGLLRLGGALERAGRDVVLEDLAYRLAAGDVPRGDGLIEACAERLVAGGAPRLALGLSCMGATLPAALAIARAVRERAPSLPILLGGPGTTDVEVRVLERFAWIDAIGRGEGEVTIAALIERLARGRRDFRGVAGVTWRDADGQVHVEADRAPLADLGEDLPDPAWHLLPPLAAYKAVTGEDDGLVPIDSGRGCVFDCSFCSIGRTWRRRSRTLPPERLLREVEHALSMPAAKQVYLCHDIFGANRADALAVCAAFEARGGDVPFEVRARIDHLDDELVAAMGRAGCYRVLLGVETGDGELRNRHGKRMDTQLDVLARVEALDRAGVAAILSLVLGLPGEGDRELARTLDLCLDASLRAPVHLSLHLPNPQPACELGAADAGASRPLEGLVPDMAWGAGESAAERELIAAHPDLFGSFAVMAAAAGGEVRLRWLRELADELPTVLMRYARTYALLTQHLGTDVLGAYRAWRSSGRSFETFALGSGSGAVADALDWERAIVRTSALGPRSDDDDDPRVRCATLVRVRFDPSIDPRAWREADRPARASRALAVLRSSSGAVRTLGVSDSVATLLTDLDGRDALELVADANTRAALEALGARGLLHVPNTQSATATRCAPRANATTTP